MAGGSQFGVDLSQFSGLARLFPLPNLVLFPGALQPLHIFESRYRDLMAEAIAGDSLIAMAVLAPGWETDYEGRPAVHPVACLGRIATYHRMSDGRYNLLLQGVARLQLLDELPPAKQFREAHARIVVDQTPDEPTVAQLTTQLTMALEQLLRAGSPEDEQLQQLVSSRVPLGTLTDLVAFAADMRLETKVALLSEADVARRTQTVLEWLKRPGGSTADASYPPKFSDN